MLTCIPHSIFYLPQKEARSSAKAARSVSRSSECSSHPRHVGDSRLLRTGERAFPFLSLSLPDSSLTTTSSHLPMDLHMWTFSLSLLTPSIFLYLFPSFSLHTHVTYVSVCGVSGFSVSRPPRNITNASPPSFIPNETNSRQSAQQTD